MEKLLALNINNNYLGSIPEFTKWCESISKSKGLLELHLCNFIFLILRILNKFLE